MYQSLSEDEDHGLYCPQPHLHLTMEECIQHWHQEGLRYVATHTANHRERKISKYTHVHVHSLVPRPSHSPVFDHLQYAKMKGEGLVHFIM